MTKVELDILLAKIVKDNPLTKRDMGIIARTPIENLESLAYELGKKKGGG